jgi:hypothetical protein
MLAYLFAGLPVEALSKNDFGFLLLLFIWFDCGFDHANYAGISRTA